VYVEVLRVHVNAPTGKQTVAWATKLQLITGILFINDIMHSLLGLSLLALQATCGSAEPSPNKSQVAEKRVPKFILRCEERIPGAEYKAWYQECMDKMANKSGLTLSAETGDYEHGWGCKCLLHIFVTLVFGQLSGNTCGMRLSARTHHAAMPCTATARLTARLALESPTCTSGACEASQGEDLV
jgi:hypothetical protein